MDNHHRNSIVEPNNGGYAGPDTRNQLNTTTTLPKPQQRGQEFVQRQPRPEFYHQGPYGAPNRPPGQPQRPPPPQQHQQQQQQPRTSGDNKASPWNIIRQTLPPEVTVRGQIQPQQQRPPLSQQQQQHQQQFYNMQQRPPPSSQDQQQLPYRQQPAPSMQERRPTLSRIDDRPPFRSENNRPVGHRPSNAAEDDEEVVVNSSTNQQQQQQPPPMIRRDSTVFAGNRAPPDLGDPNRQWQRPQGPGTMAAPSYGKPMMEQQYGRQSTVAAIPEVQEQQRYPQAANNYKQDDDGGRRSMMGVPQSQPQGPNPKAPPQLMRRDSVLDVVNSRRDSVMDTKNVKSIDPSSRRMEVVPDEYNRRSMQQDLQQEDSGSRRLPEMGGRKSQLPPDQQLREEVKRPAEYYKKTAEEQENSGSRRLSDYRNSRPPELIADYDTGTVTNKPLMSKEDKPPVRDYEQQQQSRYDRKVPLEKESVVQNVAVAEHGNRASELRKAHFEATHLKSTKDQQQQQQKHPKTQYNENRTYDVGREMKATTEDTVKSKDYAAALKSTPENELNKTNEDSVRNKDELLASQSKNLRPDTLNLIKDNEPLKDSSNSKGNYRSDNDVGKSPSKIPKKDRSEIKTPTRAITPKSPADGVMSVGQKKLPMNKIQVGSAPSPNLKVVRSKIGSLQNTSHKPGGGQVKIENRKLEWKAGTRVVAKNDTYVPGGGDKKIQSVKLQWNAKPKVGSLENKTHKPGGGDKKIETVKLDFKDKAKPKIGSKDNIKHTPGGGTVKSQSTQLLEMESPDIEDQKLEVIKAQSKVGSLENVKHKPGGGEVKIFDDKNYIKQTTGQTIGTPTKSQLQRSSSMKSPTSMKFYDSNERPKSQVKIVVTPTSEDLFIKKETDTSNDGFRKSSNVRSPSLQNNIVIPEEAVRSKK